jgi:hypothetical protein
MKGECWEDAMKKKKEWQRLGVNTLTALLILESLESGE